MARKFAESKALIQPNGTLIFRHNLQLQLLKAFLAAEGNEQLEERRSDAHAPIGLQKGDADAPEIAEAYSSGMESDPEHVYVKNDWDYVMNGANLANASVAIATTRKTAPRLKLRYQPTR